MGFNTIKIYVNSSKESVGVQNNVNQSCDMNSADLLDADYFTDCMCLDNAGCGCPTTVSQPKSILTKKKANPLGETVRDLRNLLEEKCSSDAIGKIGYILDATTKKDRVKILKRFSPVEQARIFIAWNTYRPNAAPMSIVEKWFPAAAQIISSTFINRPFHELAKPGYGDNFGYEDWNIEEQFAVFQVLEYIEEGNDYAGAAIQFSPEIYISGTEKKSCNFEYSDRREFRKYHLVEYSSASPFIYIAIHKQHDLKEIEDVGFSPTYLFSDEKELPIIGAARISGFTW